jgi:AraC-like DNA-binding protein
MSLIQGGRASDSPLVELVWTAQSESAGSFTSTAAANSEIVVTRYQGKTNITVRGPETRASLADYPPDAEFFGISLKLGVFMPHLPAKALLNRKDMTLPEATHQSFWLLGSAWQIPTYENADTFVDRLVHDGLLVRDPVVEAVLQDQPLDLSVRTVQYRFQRATGLTYKVVQQIERAQRAAALLKQGVPILDTVFEAGFFDQSHLTNSLKRFLGQTPSQIASVNMPE